MPPKMSRLPTALLLVASLIFAGRIFLLMDKHSALELAEFYMADDTFYYLVIGQNIATGAGSTFDGLAVTNGYHPLWQLLCALLFLMFPAGSDGAVLAVFAFQGLLVIATVWLLHSALRRFDAMASAVTLTLFLATPLVISVLCNGMESALAFTLTAALIALAARQGTAFYRIGSVSDGALKAGLLTALTLSRLEAGLLAAILVCETFIRETLLPLGPRATLRRDWRALPAFCLVVCGILGAVVAVYVSINIHLVGYPVPISGVVKTVWRPTEEVFWSTIWLHLVGMSGVLGISSRLQTIAPLLLTLQLVGTAAWLLDVQGRRFLGLTAPFLLFSIGFVLLAIFKTSGGFMWYLWPALLIAVLTTFALAAAVFQAGEQAMRRRGRQDWSHALAIASVVAALTLLGVRTVHDATKPSRILFDWGIEADLLDRSLSFIETEIPVSEALAGHSVGILSFFSGRPIQQTEGLVNDRVYWEALKDGHAFEELYRRGARWLVVNVLDETDLAGRVDSLIPACVSREEWRIASPRAASDDATTNVVFLRLDRSECNATGAAGGS